MGKRGVIPETSYGWIGLILGLMGSLLWMTQFVWRWFGITDADRALYSLLVLFCLCFAIGFSFVGNRLNNTRKRLKKMPLSTSIRISLLVFIAIILLMMVLNGVAMTLDSNYETYANSNYGFFTGLRQLTAVTSEDVNSLQNFALGIRQIVRSMFMITPALIGTWGGLSVLTADSVDEAEGGILAIMAAFVVFIVVWIFKAIDVSLMFLDQSSVVTLGQGSVQGLGLQLSMFRDIMQFRRIAIVN